MTRIGLALRRRWNALSQWARLVSRFGNLRTRDRLERLWMILDSQRASVREAAFETMLNLCDRFRRPEPPAESIVQMMARMLKVSDGPYAGLFRELGAYSEPALTEGIGKALYDLHKELAFEGAQSRSRIRELYLAEIFEGIEEISIPIGAVNEETAHANATDLLFVSAIARWHGARRLFEIGTYMGRTTYHLTFASEGALVTTVNLPPDADPSWGPYQQSYFKGRPREAQIRQVWADSTKMDTAPYRGQMDFVFVDADHSYEAVKADTAKAFDVLAPGGIIVWHDYAAKSPGVYRFFEEFTRERPVFRVRKTCLLVHRDGVDPLTFRALPMRPSLARASAHKKEALAKAA